MELTDYLNFRMSRNDKRFGDHQTHYFSTHFYSMLCEQGPEGVQRWTAKKGLDIFSKRLIFVPVNKALHWSLTVIVNPGAIKSHFEVLNKRTEQAESGELLIEPEDLDKPCPAFLFFDSLECHSKTTVAGKLRKWLNAEWNRRAKEMNDDVTDPFNQRSMKIFHPEGPYARVKFCCILFY